MGLEIEIGRQHASTNQLFLQNLNEIEQTLGLTATYIIYSVWWNGQAIGALLTRRGSLHNANDTLDDIVDIGEIATAVAIVEYLDGFAL